jgi:predicted nucleic acid-binding protein
VGLAWIVILAFIRITTRPGILREPLSPERAIEFVDGWLDQPYVRAVGPGEHHWQLPRNLLKTTGTAGALVPTRILPRLQSSTVPQSTPWTMTSSASPASST